VEFVPRSEHWSFPDIEAAVAWAREILWAPSTMEDDLIWSHIELLFKPHDDGLLLREPTPPTALVWWHTDG
jgi:hypothetical protein